jgi:hypothetical protein
MMCTRCNNILQRSLFRCEACYADKISDADMCESCMREHKEANDYPCKFIEVFTQ